MGCMCIDIKKNMAEHITYDLLKNLLPKENVTLFWELEDGFKYLT